jgi:hypothetical protein
MAEHDLLDREVLAVTWDGTGFGIDGTAWGGEVLRARADGYERITSLLPFPLAGNEAAIRQPRRTALEVLALALGEEAVLGDADLLIRLGLPARAAGTLLAMARRGVNTAWTSSVGRLFDAVPALLTDGPRSESLGSVSGHQSSQAEPSGGKPPWSRRAPSQSNAGMEPRLLADLHPIPASVFSAPAAPGAATSWDDGDGLGEARAGASYGGVNAHLGNPSSENMLNSIGRRLYNGSP